MTKRVLFTANNVDVCTDRIACTHPIKKLIFRTASYRCAASSLSIKK